jgi:cell division protein FtsB
MKEQNLILKVLKNKYFVTIAFFVVWMSFFDTKDWGLIRERQIKLKSLEQSEKEMATLIKDTRAELSMLKTSVESVEKYAREKYLMKKDNEDIFVVKTP